MRPALSIFPLQAFLKFAGISSSALCGMIRVCVEGGG